MSKKLLFLLPIAMLALTGCNGNKEEEKSSEDPVLSNIVIDYTIFDGQELDSSSTYYKAFSFEREGLGFATSGNKSVGLNAHRDGEQNGYNDNHIMQFKAAISNIHNTAETKIKSVSIEWWTTYDTQTDATYFPKVTAGDDDNVEGYTAVECNEGSSLTGTAVEGVKQGSGDGYQVYKYVTTYTIPEGKGFVAFGAGAGAMYAKTVTIVRQ